MKLISPLLKRVLYPCLASAGAFDSKQKKGLAAVTYHDVLPPNFRPIDPGFDGSRITPEHFRQQLRLLKSKYNVISPEEMLSWCRNEWELPPRAVLLTCDDGALNNLTEMLPILQEEGLRAIFFVTGASTGGAPTMLWYEELFLVFLRAPAGKIQISVADLQIEGVLGAREQRRSFWWNVVRRLSQVDAKTRERFLEAAHAQFGLERALDHYGKIYPQARRHFGLLVRAELQQLVAAGMTIGAHTLTHPVLTEQPVELAWTEITESRAALESALNRKIWAFAYPFGDAGSVSPQIFTMAQEAGFDAAFVNVGGGLGAELPRHAIPRVHVNADMNLAEFEAHVSGFYTRLHRAVSLKHSVRSRVPLWNAPADTNLRSLS